MFPSEIEDLRRLREDKFNSLSTNYRPIQKLNGRIVNEFYEWYFIQVFYATFVYKSHNKINGDDRKSQFKNISNDV